MDNPWLRQIEPSRSSEEAIIFMTGYCTEEDCEPYHHRHWIKNLREAGWRGAMYYLWWDSSNPRNSKSVMWQTPLGNLAHWNKHKGRAKCVGKYYLESIVSSQVKETSVSLIGHSLGVRVIFFGIQNWSNRSSHLLKDVFLLGGAVPKNRDWAGVASRLSGELFNIYNSCDPVLKEVYRVTSLGLNPCGLRPIEKWHSKISNLDVTSWVGKSHSLEKYLNTLPKLAQQGDIEF